MLSIKAKATKTVHLQEGAGENPVQDLQHKILISENGPSDQKTLPPITSEEVTPALGSDVKDIKLVVPKLAVSDTVDGDWWVLE